MPRRVPRACRPTLPVRRVRTAIGDLAVAALAGCWIHRRYCLQGARTFARTVTCGLVDGVPSLLHVGRGRSRELSRSRSGAALLVGVRVLHDCQRHRRARPQPPVPPPRPLPSRRRPADHHVRRPWPTTVAPEPPPPAAAAHPGLPARRRARAPGPDRRPGPAVDHGRRRPEPTAAAPTGLVVVLHGVGGAGSGHAVGRLRAAGRLAPGRWLPTRTPSAGRGTTAGRAPTRWSPGVAVDDVRFLRLLIEETAAPHRRRRPAGRRGRVLERRDHGRTGGVRAGRQGRRRRALVGGTAGQGFEQSCRPGPPGGGDGGRRLRATAPCPTRAAGWPTGGRGGGASWRPSKTSSPSGGPSPAAAPPRPCRARPRSARREVPTAGPTPRSCGTG